LSLFFLGLGAGIVAGIVDVGSQWTSSLKNGVCQKEFWLNREQC
jgi:hypothetical protein